MSLNDQQYAIDDLSLQCAIRIIHLAIEHLEGPFRGVVKLRRGLICMREKVDQNLLHLVIFSHRKPLDEIFHPNLSMVLDVLPNQLI